MMNRFTLLLAMGGVLSTLSACSMYAEDEGMFRDRDRDYLRAETSPELTVPEGMHKPAFEPLYPVPNVSALDEFGDKQSLAEFQVPRPNTVTADENVFGVKIQRLSDESWIFISAPTSQVWPHVQSYLAQSEVDVVNSNVQSGLIETGWLTYSDDDSVVARFRISLEKGLHPDTTEVHILEYQQAVDGDVSAPKVWPSVSTDEEREKWMVKQVATHLAETISNASASLLGQNVGGKVKAQIVSGAVEPTLRLNISKGRALATISHAADQEGFVTWDRSESRAIIYAGYNENQHKKTKLWRKIFLLGYSGKLPEEVDYSLGDVLKHLSGASDVRRVFDGVEGVEYNDALEGVEPGYLILVRFDAEGADVVIRDHRGRRPPVDEAKTLIRLLRKNLI